MGQVGDREGQRTILVDMLNALKSEEMSSPGGRIDLPYEWPEPVRQTVAHPSPPPPIVGYLKRRPFQWSRLVNRDVPA